MLGLGKRRQAREAALAARQAEDARVKQTALDELDNLLTRVESRDSAACQDFGINDSVSYSRARATANHYGDSALRNRVTTACFTAQDVIRYEAFLPKARALLATSRDGRASVTDRINAIADLLQGWHGLDDAEQEQQLAQALNFSQSETATSLAQLLDQRHFDLMSRNCLDQAQQLRHATRRGGMYGWLGAKVMSDPSGWIELVSRLIPTPTLVNLNASPEETPFAAGLKAASAIEHSNLPLALEVLARCNRSPEIRRHIGDQLFADLNKVVESLRRWSEVTETAAAIAIANQQ